MKLGHARERSPGRWELRVYVGRDPISNRKRYATKTVSVDGPKAAERELARFEAAVAVRGEPARDVTVGALLERWYAFGVAQELWSPGVEVLHRRVISTRLRPLHDRPLGGLRAIDLDDLYAALRVRGSVNGGPLAPSTVVRTHGVLSLALDQAVRWDLIGANPCDNAQPSRLHKKRIVAPPSEAVVALLAAALERYAELFCFLFLDAETGARRGELAALRLNDFDMAAATVRIERALTTGHANDANARRYAGRYWPAAWERGAIPTALIEKAPKNEDSVRTLALSPATLDLVRGQTTAITARLALAGLAYPGNGFLFPAIPGDGRRPTRPDTWTRRFVKLRDALGVPVRLHDLRHFVATTLLTSGVDLATVAGRLGHGGGGKTTLAIYGNPTRASDQAASALMVNVLRAPAADVDGTVVSINRRRRGGS